MLLFTKKFMHLGRRGAEEHPSHPTIPSLPSLRAAPAHAFAAASPVAMATAHCSSDLICSAPLPINARERVALRLGLGSCSLRFSASALLPSPFQLPRSRTNSQGNGVGLPMLASCKHAVNRYLKVVGAALSSLPEPLHLLPVTFSCKCLKLLIL